MAKNIAVFGLFPNLNILGTSIDSLRSRGFREVDISALVPKNVGNKDIGVHRSTKAPEGAVVGSLIGAAIGGAAAWCASAGMVPVAGAEIFAAAGGILSVFAGVGGGGVVGSFLGALAGATQPEYEARRFSGRVKRSGILLSVHCDDAEWAKRARSILAESGAVHIGEAQEARADFSRTDKPISRFAMNSPFSQ